MSIIPKFFNPLNAELNPICCLLALLGAHHFLHVGRIRVNFHRCVVNLDTIESFIYPTDAQIDCSKNVKIYITIYNIGAATCFGFPHPSSGSYCMCFAKVISINNQLKYVVYRISSV